MTIEYPELVGTRLAEVDPELLAETLENLTSGNISPVAHVPRPNEIALIAERLRNARIRWRCGCGQDDCRTYHLAHPHKTHNVRLHTIRFCARGEALLHLDGEGDAYSIERIYDLREGAPVTVYSLCADGVGIEIGLAPVRCAGRVASDPGTITVQCRGARSIPETRVTRSPTLRSSPTKMNADQGGAAERRIGLRRVLLLCAVDHRGRPLLTLCR